MWLAQFLLVLASMATVVALVAILLYFARLYVLDEPARTKVCDDVMDYATTCGGGRPCAAEPDPFDEFSGSYSVSSSASEIRRRGG